MTALFALFAMLLAQAPESPLASVRCPESDPNVVCRAEAGPNHAFLFSYPAEVRAITMLNASFRRAQFRAREDFEALISEARRSPEGNFSYEEVYTIDASRPELLALAVRQVQRAGGDEARWSVGSLIWDRRGGRLLNFEELFEDAAAGQALVNQQFCGALRQARDAALGGEGHDDCPDLYFARLIAGGDGRIDRLQLTFDPMDGLDDGRFDVEIPVTRVLIESLQRQFRAAFAPSGEPAKTCHRASLGESCALRAAERQPQ